MKQIIFLVVILSSISMSLMALSAATITSASVLVKSATSQGVNLVYTPNADIGIADSISFSTTTTEDSAKKITFSAAPTSPITTSVAFPEAGAFNILVTSGGAVTKQNVMQAVCETGITATTIKTTTAADVKVNTAASVKFTLTAAKTLYDTDKIIFSISTGADPATDAADTKEHVLTGVTFTAAEITQSVTFTKAGTYNIWVQRGATKTKQTDQTVTVNSAFLSISLALFLGLFLF